MRKPSRAKGREVRRRSRYRGVVIRTHRVRKEQGSWERCRFSSDVATHEARRRSRSQ